jgi:hypothetical protein
LETAPVSIIVCVWGCVLGEGGVYAILRIFQILNGPRVYTEINKIKRTWCKTESTSVCSTQPLTLCTSIYHSPVITGKFTNRIIFRLKKKHLYNNSKYMFLPIFLDFQSTQDILHCFYLYIIRTTLKRNFSHHLHTPPTMRHFHYIKKPIV